MMEPCECGGAYPAWEVGALREHRATKRHQQWASRQAVGLRIVRPPRLGHKGARPCPGDGTRGCLAMIPADRERCQFDTRTMGMAR